MYQFAETHQLLLNLQDNPNVGSSALPKLIYATTKNHNLQGFSDLTSKALKKSGIGTSSS